MNKKTINAWGKLVILSTIGSNTLLLAIVVCLYISPDTIKHHPNIDHTWAWWQGINCVLLIEHWIMMIKPPKEGR